jgi:hypothetical protein
MAMLELVKTKPKGKILSAAIGIQFTFDEQELMDKKSRS